jgi:hypothetical protein
MELRGHVQPVLLLEELSGVAIRHYEAVIFVRVMRTRFSLHRSFRIQRFDRFCQRFARLRFTFFRQCLRCVTPRPALSPT